jgi:hypothetical protein
MIKDLNILQDIQKDWIGLRKLMEGIAIGKFVNRQV